MSTQSRSETETYAAELLDEKTFFMTAVYLFMSHHHQLTWIHCGNALCEQNKTQVCVKM